MNLQKLKMFGLGLLVVSVASGCASAKKGGEMAKAAAPAAAAAGSTGAAAASADSSGAAAAGAAAGAAMGKDDAYTVRVGDCLWCISGMEEIFNNPYMWPLILKANTDQITDADLILPGWELIIPRGFSDAEKARAVNHAHTRGAWELGVVEDSDKKYLSSE